MAGGRLAGGHIDRSFTHNSPRNGRCGADVVGAVSDPIGDEDTERRGQLEETDDCASDFWRSDLAQIGRRGGRQYSDSETDEESA